MLLLLLSCRSHEGLYHTFWDNRQKTYVSLSATINTPIPSSVFPFLLLFLPSSLIVSSICSLIHNLIKHRHNGQRSQHQAQQRLRHAPDWLRPLEGRRQLRRGCLQRYQGWLPSARWRLRYVFSPVVTATTNNTRLATSRIDPFLTRQSSCPQRNPCSLPLIFGANCPRKQPLYPCKITPPPHGEPYNVGWQLHEALFLTGRAKPRPCGI